MCASVATRCTRYALLSAGVRSPSPFTIVEHALTIAIHYHSPPCAVHCAGRVSIIHYYSLSPPPRAVHCAGRVLERVPQSERPAPHPGAQVRAGELGARVRQVRALHPCVQAASSGQGGEAAHGEAVRTLTHFPPSLVVPRIHHYTHSHSSLPFVVQVKEDLLGGEFDVCVTSFETFCIEQSVSLAFP